MATRNLTKKFVDIRNATKANKSLLRSKDDGTEETHSDSGLLNQGGETTNWRAMKGAASLPPRWVDDIEKTEEDIKNIQAKIKELSALHTKRLMVNFEADEAQQEHEIDLKTQEITDHFRHAEGLLKRFSKQDERDIPSAELTVRTNIQRSIAKRLQGLSMSFRSTQKEYLSRLQAQKTESGGIFEFETKTSMGRLEIDSGFTDSQLQVVDDIDEVVNQRDQEIVNIAKSIEELAAIFRELAVLVIDQGTILDRIDYNMESAVEHAKEGIVQLEKAEEHQKNSLPVKCIILLIFLIAVMVAILIIKHTPSLTKK